MRPRRIFVAAVLAAAVLGPAAIVAARPQLGSSPTATSDHATATVGSMVRVQGANWGQQGSGVVNVQVCGNGGVERSVDCDLAGTASGAIRAGGSFFTAITIHPPPKPCPCVLRVTSSVTPYEVRIPIAIPGLPIAPVAETSPTKRSIKITKLSIQSERSIAAWFGAAPKRTVQFTLVNDGNVTLTAPALDLTFGRGTDPDGFMPSPDVPPLAPGERKVIRATVPLGAGSIGTYHVAVAADPIGGIDDQADTTTSTYPWGLFVIALVLLQVIFVRIRNRTRRGAEAAAAANAPDEGDQTESAGPDEPAESQDLETLRS